MTEQFRFPNVDGKTYLQLFRARISHSSRIKRYRHILERILEGNGAVFGNIHLYYHRVSCVLVLGTYVSNDLPRYFENLKRLQEAADILSLVSEEQPPVIDLKNMLY